MSRLLVLGATGLIGSEFVRQAPAAGHDVTVVCRSASAVEGARIIQGDLAEPQDLLRRLAGERFDAIVYLAQAADHNGFPANASNAVAVNIAAPVALCQWAVESGCSKFILASSGGICGPAEERTARISEAWPRLQSGRLNFYLSTKARCEELLEAFRDRIELVSLRYFFVYGRSQRPDFLFPRLARKVLAGEPIELAGGEGPWLNPIHVSDAAGLTLAALATTAGTTNVAGPQDASLRSIVSELERVLGRSAVIQDVDGPAPSFLADIDRMSRTLGIPKIKLAQGFDLAFAKGESA